MKTLPFALPEAGRLNVGGVPEGHDARLIATLAEHHSGGVLHVAVDDVRLTRLIAALAFFAPKQRVIAFPAWDCLPYDRVSPHRDILARRVDALTDLAHLKPDDARPIVVTTVAAILQRVPHPKTFAAAAQELHRGQLLSQQQLIEYLLGNGYLRSGTVGEPGEFAVRGGIVDLYPPGAPQPLRVDFFGDEVEDIRLFDALSQRSQEKIERFILKPVNEVTLNPAAIERFRSGYREAFGSTADDPLYEAISAGRQYPGMEHWLPLFVPDLVPLTHYLPNALVTVDHQGDQAKTARLEMIADFYQARTDLQRAEKESGAPVYHPLQPSRLYLTDNGWQQI